MSEELLISLIKQNPALWDRNDRYYRDKHVKLVQWRTVASRCNFKTVDDCKAKWKALREKYRRELVIEEKFLRTGNTNIGRPNWYLMNSMAFLKNSMSVRSYFANLDDTFLDMDEDGLNDASHEYIEIKSEPVLDLPEPPVLTKADTPMNTEEIEKPPMFPREAEMPLLIEERKSNYLSPRQIASNNSVLNNNFCTNSNSSSAININSNNNNNNNNSIPSIQNNEVANFMKQITDAVSKIREEKVDDTDRRIAAFTTYLREELRRIPQKECEDLMDDIMNQVLTKKRKLRNSAQDAYQSTSNNVFHSVSVQCVDKVSSDNETKLVVDDGGLNNEQNSTNDSL